MQPSRSPSAYRSVRIHESSLVVEYSPLKMRYMTSRTGGRPAVRSAGPGSSNRMFAADRVRLACTTRWAMRLRE